MKNKFNEEKEIIKSNKKRKKYFTPYKKDKYNVTKLKGYQNYLNDLDFLESIH